MLNKLYAFIRQQDMLQPGDTLICAVSGGADSMALLWSMFLLQDKLRIHLEAAHFNHHLRGEESMRDEAFVQNFCNSYQIPCHIGNLAVTAGKKGLEAAARDARYAFFNTLHGKIATAHTADDNAETVLMHLIRGTGLKGLGAIAPKAGNILRPMLNITRDEVLSFLESYSIPHITDSSNQTDDFLRNRIRHHVMPLLYRENPQFARNLSLTAQRLRDDEALLQSLTAPQEQLEITTLRTMPQAQRNRVLAQFLTYHGIPEPDSRHIALAEKLVFSDNPSAKANFPGNITICRCYDRLIRATHSPTVSCAPLPCPGSLELPEQGLRVHCFTNAHLPDSATCFRVKATGALYIRHRLPGDRLRTTGGTKLLKQLFIDRKIPAQERLSVPVVCDDVGILGVYGLGGHYDRLDSSADAITIYFEQIK